MSYDWMKRAACKDADPELFFPAPRGEQNKNEEQKKNEEALAYCARCEVVEECLELALKTHAGGIWGGMTEAQREAYRRRRYRQRTGR